MLLPARDERLNIADCLESLLSQAARPRVRVIDDGSSDGTGSVVAGLAASEPRLELIEAGPLPDGWRGKVHALWVGARGVATPWILLTDADTRHSPDLLARALAAAQEGRLDALSLAGNQEVRGAGEALITPAVFALLDALLGDWQEAGSAKGPAVANGQFLLVKREPWEAAGGFEAVRNEAIDDVAIVTRLRRNGGRTAFFREADLRVRMYRGTRETWNGWRRNLGGILGARTGLAAAILTVLLVPALALAGFLAAGRWVEAVLLWSAGASASMVLRRNSPVWGLLYPLDSLLLAALLCLSTLDRRRGRLMSWKGREMKV